ncbi:MAG: hypothetical protein SH807_03860 [Blastochloris sp.]|nr:hypothetical protein [Blastochloris sp.]
MRLILLILVLLLLPSKLVFAELPEFSQENLSAWWEPSFNPETWETAYTELSAQLNSLHEKEGLQSFTANISFTPWFNTLGWLGLGLNYKELVSDPALVKAFLELGKMPEVSHLLFRSLKPGDDAAKALEILLRIQIAYPDKIKDYAALAVAYAVVFDQDYPKNWPHHQVARKAVPFGNPTATERFQFYVESNETNKLEFDLKKLSVTELKYVVDSFINFDELRYAQKSKISRSKFEQAYSSIDYDYPRIKVDAYNWGYENYLLADIETKGGICTDQAYYAATLGKGRGIPTLYFSGQGSSGGHAWFGYMVRSGKWELDCGRYATHNYAVGEAVDSQSWQSINDAELEFIFKSLERNPNYETSQTLLLWAYQQKDSAAALKALGEARSLNPENPEIWKIEAAMLTANKTEPAQMKTFYEAWVQQFTRNPDMKVEGQMQLVEVLNLLQDPTAETLQKSIVSQNKNKRTDLGITAGAEALFKEVEAKNWKEAEDQFKKLIRRFDDNGGGNLFYDVVRPYVKACMENDQKKQAKDGLKFSVKKIRMDEDSILAKEFKKLEKYVDDGEK